MNKITEKFSRSVNRPIRVMQFGEGNFLRAFADYFIDILNEKTDFNGGIAIVKPIPFGNLDNFKAQDNLYTVILRGRKNGEVVNAARVVTSVESVIDAKEDFEEYMSLSRLETLRVVISNTTEAGMVLRLMKTIISRVFPIHIPVSLQNFFMKDIRRLAATLQRVL